MSEHDRMVREAKSARLSNSPGSETYSVNVSPGAALNDGAFHHVRGI
jgi:hypothetical protein